MPLLLLLGIDAGAAELSYDAWHLKESLHRCHVQLNTKVLANMAIWEPRTFRSGSNFNNQKKPGECYISLGQFYTIIKFLKQVKWPRFLISCYKNWFLKLILVVAIAAYKSMQEPELGGLGLRHCGPGTEVITCGKL